MFEQLLFARLILHFDRDHVLTACGDDLVDLPRQLQRFGFAQLGLIGSDSLFGFDVMIRKEPLRFLTRRSAVAVIVPVDFLGHREVLS